MCGRTRPSSKRFAMASSARDRAAGDSVALRSRRHAKAGPAARTANPGRHKILVQAPMSFHDMVQNHPFVLKSCAARHLAGVARRAARAGSPFIPSSTTPPTWRPISLRASPTGCHLCWSASSAIAHLFASRRVRRRHQFDCGQHSGTSYVFLRPRLGVREFSAITASSMRGLYPGSLVAMFDTARLRHLVGAMLHGLEKCDYCNQNVDSRLLPSPTAAADIGSFAQNQTQLREILAE